MCELTKFSLLVALAFAWVFCFAPPAMAEDDVYSAFQTPSGNIHCGIHLKSGATQVECQMRDFQRNSNREFQSCLDLAQVFVVSDQGRAGISCSGSTLIFSENPQLPYGSSIQLGDILCSSEDTGVTCSNALGDGFRISRRSQEFFGNEGSTDSAESTPVWNASIVFDGEVEVDACLDAGHSPECLRLSGFNEDQIEFLNFIHGGYNAQIVPRKFYELGDVDVAELELINNEVRYPALLNGAIGFYPLHLDESVQDSIQRLAEAAGIPEANELMNVFGEIVEFRQLENGGQRFVYRELLTQGCKRCAISATAISYIDVAPNKTGPLVQEIKAVFPDGKYEFVLPRVSDEQSLEVALTVHGYDVGPVDGLLSSDIGAAIEQFQMDRCRPPTGKLSNEDLDDLLRIQLVDPCG